MRLTAALADRYRIERELGQGGMATVYLAEDLKHDRKVALKVLKPELAAVLGAERFVVEIKTTAALQHPHILPLFDSGTADGFLFYVMPFIDGETLRGKLDRETQLGIEEAVRITTEVADALDYAHRHSVIHRDIKPENILLHDGRPMVADFGIALAVSAAAGGRMTETGLSLGTPHYMSPEQATAAKEITARSDVYSLASVLYEMLAGSPPHTGATAQQIIMKIVTEDARPIATLRRSVPGNVAAALARALEKLPADRFESAREFADALRDGRFAHRTVASRAGERPAGALSDMRLARGALIGGGALAVLGLAAAGWAWRGRDEAPAPAPVQLTLEVEGANPDLTRFAVSPDGAVFSFATDEGLAVRDAGQRGYRVLPGTQSAESPSFSPDGQWIAYQARGRLRKIAVRGGSALSLITGDSLLVSRVEWGEDGSIVFEAGRQLYLIAGEGGAPRLLPGSVGAQSPRLLPDGSGILYVDARRGSRLMLYDLAAGSATPVLEESSEGQYVASGYIVYGHPNGGLFAVRFDPKRRAVTGAPMPLVDDLRVSGAVTPFRVTRSGMLVYRTGLDTRSRLLMRDVRGRIDTLPIPPQIVSYARFSPDGHALAITVGAARGTNRHTAIHDLRLGTLTQFTLEGGGHAPVWSPDGRRIAFSAESEDSDAEDLFVQPVDRSAPATRLVRMPADQHASAWPADTVLAFSGDLAGRAGNAGGGDLFLVNPSVPGAAPRPYLSAPWSEGDLAISPDGRFAAYTSDQMGGSEIFLRHFPAADAGGLLQVSIGGGRRARWSPDGRTILYQGLDDRTIHAARVRTEPSLAVLSREVLLTLPGMESAWDVDSRTGRIVVAQAVVAEATRIIVVTDWRGLLRGDGR
jgi:eukaryotic-like serine/threonine-protein kinase